MESKVFLFFSKLIEKICQWFDESLCGKAYNRFCKWLSLEFSKSHIGKFFENKGESEIFKNSILGKIVSIPSRILLFLQDKLSDRLNKAMEESVICGFFNKWQDISIRFYGVVLSVFSLFLIALRPSGRIGYLLLFALLISGILMILINRSLRNLVGGSFIISHIRDLFLDSSPKEVIMYSCGKTEIFVSTVIGIILAISCLMFGIVKPLVVVLAVLGFAFFLKYLSLGVFLTVALSPVLPTMVLVGLSFLCAAVFCVHVIKDKTFRFSKNPVNAFCVFFAIALLWGVVNSFSLKTSLLQAAVHISFILFYFVIVNVLRTKEQWLALIKVFVVSAFIVSLYGILQNFIGINSTESWVDEEMFEDISIRVYSFFDNPNVLGEFLVMTVPVCLAVMWGKMRESHKTLFGFILISMAACMIFTWSRGAWLGVFLAVALFLVIMDKRWVFAGALLLMVLPVLMVLSGNTAILERLLSIGNTADTSTAYRVSIWEASINLIRDFWISGIGIGSDAYKVIYPAYALSGANFALHSHNLYLQVWVEMGVIGIISLISLVFAFVKQVFSKDVMELRKEDNNAKIVIALGAGLLGYLFQGLTDYVWYNYKILMIFWIIIALSVSGVNLLKEKGEDL